MNIEYQYMFKCIILRLIYALFCIIVAVTGVRGDNMKLQLRIVLLAPSCSGKTTAANHLKQNYNCEILKLASPLYKIQAYMYEVAETYLNKEQDGELLRDIYRHLIRINPKILTDTFRHSLPFCRMVVNDDCRRENLELLLNLGFVPIVIDSDPKHRQDITSPKDSSFDWNRKELYHLAIANKWDIIHNDGTIQDLMKKFDRWMSHYLYKY